MLWVPALLLAMYSSSYSQELEDSFTLNLNNSDILSLIDAVSIRTGRNFIIDPRVQGSVSVVSNTPVDNEELYDMFLSVLQIHGYAAIPSGSVTKIVPEVSAKQGAIPLLRSTNQSSDQLASVVIPLLNVSASKLLPVLRPMVPQEGQLSVFAETNSLIITDRVSNINRLREIIRTVDKPEREEVESVNLNFVSATHVLEVLGPIVRNDNSATSLQLVADNRTNTVLLQGDKADRKRVVNLIRMLDSPLESNRNTRVIPLKFAEAGEIAIILRDTLGGQTATRTSQSGGLSFDQSSNFESFESEEEFDEDFPEELPSFDSFRPNDNNSSTTNFLVTADENTNSLIITAPADKMENSLDIIRQLDVRRDQVMVEAVIAEINEDSVRELGFNFLFNDGSGATGITNLGGTDLTGVSSALGEGTLLDSVSSGVSLALGRVGEGGADFGLLLRAIASDSDNNILSTPTIVALDNEEAEIVVGSNVPFITGQQLGDGNDNPFQTVERQDVGLTLKVTPKINDGETITLELEQDASSVNPTALTGAVDITTSTRSLKTTVLVDNGQTIILGGLLDETLSESEEKIPLLGDIPLVGRLFRFNTNTRSKTNLVIFLRPVILRDKETTTTISDVTIDRLSPTRELREGKKDAALVPIPPITIRTQEQSREAVSEVARARAGQQANRRPIKREIVPVSAAEADRKLKEFSWKTMPDGSMKLVK